MFTLNVFLESIILILILVNVALLQINWLYTVYCIITIFCLIVIDYLYTKIRELEYEE